MVALFLLTTSAYFSSTYGVFTSNAGSHLALIKAMAENKTFALGAYAILTGYTDYSFHNGAFYSDRAPGTAVAALPFYAVGKAISSIIPLPAYYRGMDAGNPAVFTTLLFPTFTGGLSVVLLYLLCRRLGASIYASTVTAVVFGFGTMIWKYSGDIFSHSLNTFLLLLGVYMMLGLKDFKRQRYEACLLFFIIGYLPSVEYPNAIMSGLMLLYMLHAKTARLGDMLSLKGEYKTPLLCLIVPVAGVLAYHAVNFGSPFNTPYTFHHFEYYSGSFWNAFDVPWSVGIPGLLFTNNGIDGGLIVVTPVLILALWGWMYILRARKNEALLFLAMFVSHLLLYSKHHTWNGGGVSDTRYLLHVTPLLLLPLSAWIDDFLLKRKTLLEKTLFEGLMWSLLAVSVLNVMDDLATFEGHGLRTFTFPVLHQEQFNLDFGGVFPNIGYLPVYLGIVAICYAILSLALKRVPGFEITSTDGARYNPVVFGLIALGLIAVFTFSAVPEGPVTLTDWQYSGNGFTWGRGDPPFNIDGPLMYVKGVVNVPGPKTKVAFQVAASDCISGIYINNELAATVTNCSTCLHCKGVPLDLTRYMPPGKNSIGFEIVGLHNNTQFMVQK